MQTAIMVQRVFRKWSEWNKTNKIMMEQQIRLGKGVIKMQAAFRGFRMRSILKLLALVTCIDNGVWTRGAHSHEYGFRVFLPQEVLPEAEAGVVFHQQPTILAFPMEAIPKELSTCGFLSTAGSLPTCCQDVDGLGRCGKAKTWRGSGVRQVRRSMRSGDVRIVH